MDAWKKYIARIYIYYTCMWCLIYHLSGASETQQHD